MRSSKWESSTVIGVRNDRSDYGHELHKLAYDQNHELAVTNSLCYNAPALLAPK